MVYRFCAALDSFGNDAFDDVAHRLAHAAYLLQRDPDAAALLVNGILPDIINAWYARQGDYPPARDQLLRDLAERAPDIAHKLRQALRVSDAPARLAAAERLLALARGEAAVSAVR